MFKIIFFVGLVALVFWVLGAKSRARRDPPPATPPTPAAPPQPQSMVSCAQCGLHLPRGDALPGRGGVFCSAAHRQAYEAANAGD